jgi:S-adenosylmethionine synthetase
MADEAGEQIAAVIWPVLGGLGDEGTELTVRGAGRDPAGGPRTIIGMTGRKPMVDTYGSWATHGGGAFSGKDATRLDRSAAYMARYVAKNVVAARLAEECLLQLAYCPGSVDPVSVMAHTYGTGTLDDDALASLVRRVFPLSPKGIIDHLDLRRPVYRGTAAYGHFGRREFTWERADAVDELRAKASAV